ncbi:hypothetical protein BN159_0304 [Streptomyces davaonensis JCM 4913]|uniref:Uncharacterized protein n=1 Tax=Streptomyces davaonensis (strain DSM 101723 / JCM 4913 / KCC S-0913 / 768) TaxID=1214101 RepID=K4QUN1_STRDJ|nr:hypothetical protein BN159_0304 [Streptomyces davaonensis JCM 4913]
MTNGSYECLLACDHRESGSVDTTTLINIVGAAEDCGIRFHPYHLQDKGRVGMRTYRKLEGREITTAPTGKGHPLTKNQVIPISDEEPRNGQTHPPPGVRTASVSRRAESCGRLLPARRWPGPGEAIRTRAPGPQVPPMAAIAEHAWPGHANAWACSHARRRPDEIRPRNCCCEQPRRRSRARQAKELLAPPVEVTEEEISGAAGQGSSSGELSAGRGHRWKALRGRDFAQMCESDVDLCASA